MEHFQFWGISFRNSEWHSLWGFGPISLSAAVATQKRLIIAGLRQLSTEGLFEGWPWAGVWKFRLWNIWYSDKVVLPAKGMEHLLSFWESEISLVMTPYLYVCDHCPRKTLDPESQTSFPTQTHCSVKRQMLFTAEGGAPLEQPLSRRRA